MTPQDQKLWLLEKLKDKPALIESRGVDNKVHFCPPGGGTTFKVWAKLENLEKFEKKVKRCGGFSAPRKYVPAGVRYTEGKGIPSTAEQKKIIKRFRDSGEEENALQYEAMMLC